MLSPTIVIRIQRFLAGMGWFGTYRRRMENERTTGRLLNEWDGGDSQHTDASNKKSSNCTTKDAWLGYDTWILGSTFSPGPRPHPHAAIPFVTIRNAIPTHPQPQRTGPEGSGQVRCNCVGIRAFSEIRAGSVTISDGLSPSGAPTAQPPVRLLERNQTSR